MTVQNKISSIQHLGIIMDGNSRWANSKNLSSHFGHKQGLETATSVINMVAKMDIPHLSLYAFSIENWARPSQEVNELLSLLELYLETEINNLVKNNILLHIIGSTTNLSRNLQNQIQQAIIKTQNNTGMNLYIAFSYGGKQEIVDTCKKIINSKISADDLTVENYSQFLYSPQMPNLDLVIRTGGQHRISNFLLWHIAYAELYFINKFWPDFDETDLKNAINNFCHRDRTFGAR